MLKNPAFVRQRGAFVGVEQPVTLVPVDVFLEHVHPVEGMQHVVKGAAREEHVVDVLFAAVRNGKLKDSEAPLEDAEEAFNILAHALQHLAPHLLFNTHRGFRGGHENRPLRVDK